MRRRPPCFCCLLLLAAGGLIRFAAPAAPRSIDRGPRARASITYTSNRRRCREPTQQRRPTRLHLILDGSIVSVVCEPLLLGLAWTILWKAHCTASARGRFKQIVPKTRRGGGDRSIYLNTLLARDYNARMRSDLIVHRRHRAATQGVLWGRRV